MLIKPAHDPAGVTVVESSLVGEFLLPEVSLGLNEKVPRDAGAFGRESGRWSTAAKKLVWLTFDDDAQPRATIWAFPERSNHETTARSQICFPTFPMNKVATTGTASGGAHSIRPNTHRERRHRTRGKSTRSIERDCASWEEASAIALERSLVSLITSCATSSVGACLRAVSCSVRPGFPFRQPVNGRGTNASIG